MADQALNGDNLILEEEVEYQPDKVSAGLANYRWARGSRMKVMVVADCACQRDFLAFLFCHILQEKPGVPGEILANKTNVNILIYISCLK